MEQTTQQVTTTEQTEGKLVVSFNRPTPAWATWVFRSIFVVTTAITLIFLPATHLIAEANKFEIALWLKGLDFIVWGIGRGLGIKKTDFETQ